MPCIYKVQHTLPNEQIVRADSNVPEHVKRSMAFQLVPSIQEKMEISWYSGDIVRDTTTLEADVVILSFTEFSALMSEIQRLQRLTNEQPPTYPEPVMRFFGEA